MVTPQEIKGYKLFFGLAESELAGLARLCDRRTFEGNMLIFDPDHPSEDVFIVEGGNETIQIEIPITSSDDKIVIHTLSRGETFGWAPLGTQNVRTATARCLGPVSVISINGKSLLQYLEQNRQTGYIVMKNLVDIISARLSYTTVAFRHEMRVTRGTSNVAGAA
jgi:CRP-like cAMP-binding protein